MEEDSTIGQNEKLRAEIQIAKRRKIFFDKLAKAVPVTGITIFSLMSIVYFGWSREPWILIFGGFYFAIAIIYPFIDLGKSIALEIESLQSELDLNLTGTDAKEQRAERLFRAHEIDLRRYYDQALTHSNAIFLLGVFCVVIGFCFVGVSFYLVYSEMDKPDFAEKVLIGSIGTISGVLTNFVAVVYLKMYAETVNSFTTFHNKLVTTNHLHFANFLTAKISDKSVVDNTLRDLSIKIIDGVNKQ